MTEQGGTLADVVDDEAIADSASARALSADGEFARGFDGFRPRAAQQAMAARVEQAIARGSVLIAESGTGTGKTFAYLVPVLLSGARVIVSTGTRHLQDQLFGKDLPAVRRVLGAPARVERLKGRANYLCLHRLEQAGEMTFGSAGEVDDLARVREFARSTSSGDISEARGIADDAPIWARLTTGSDGCLGARCDFINDCFVYKARRRAMTADIVVVNHHLFFSDMALKDEGFGEVLPDYDCVIFDEAHLIPEIAAQFFGFSFSSSQVRTMCREVAVAESSDKSGVVMNEAIIAVERAVNELVLAVKSGERGNLEELAAQPEFAAGRARLADALRALAGLLESAASAGDNLALVHERCVAMLGALAQFDEVHGDDLVLWYETGKRSLRLQATPVSVGEFLKSRLFGGSTGMVFTSATLCDDGAGSHFRGAMGIDEAEVCIWHSPFDYSRRALLYVPENMPDPAEPSFPSVMCERIMPVLRASRGRAFVLFTSYRVMHAVHELVRERGEFKLLLQGEKPRQALIDEFRAAPATVLFGTTSFWEGVDVKGEALVCVIIDKLPFASPFDPVNRARLAHIESHGGSAFNDYLLPRAVLMLKQGAGRLIRDEDDYGVLMICDPRLVSRGYGRRFLDALPPMRRTRREELVVRFFDHHAREAGQ